MDGCWTRRRFVRATAAAGIGAALQAVWPARQARAALAAPADLSAVTGADCYQSTLKAVELLGGMGRFVPKGATVGLLINHPFRNPGTHVNPEVALAVLKLCYDAGAKTVRSLKDEPSGYWQRSRKAKDQAGEIQSLVACSGAYATVEVPKGRSLKKAEIIKETLEVDVLVNVSIAKDHEGTRFSAILKNMMGALPYSTCRFFHYGHNKGGWYGDVDFLSQCVADINTLRRPDLSVCDATEFVTTGGPFGPGKLAKPQAVVAGASPVTVDAYCTRFLGLDAARVAMIRKAAEAGLGEMDLGKVKLAEVRL
jgi:uncharacterized protein (DUF362 family)